jgi:ABC-type molybdate transport system substrate-binding protein
MHLLAGFIACFAALFATANLPSAFAQEKTVTVFAAASLKKVLDDINGLHQEHRHRSGCKLCGKFRIDETD